MIKLSYDAEHDAVVVEFVGRVDAGELEPLFRKFDRILPKGRREFRLVSDLSATDSMDLEVKNQIARSMDFFNARGVSEVYRVLPDPDLDIAFNVLSAAHYGRSVRQHTVRSREEAWKLLGRLPSA